MADTTSNDLLKRRKHSRRFASKLVPDMTAMVGLGFLLVTFFIMAGEFTKSVVMRVTMPMRPTEDYGDSGCGMHSAVTTLLLGKNHQVHYYHGLRYSFEEVPKLYTTNLGSAGLRQVLLRLQQQNPRTVILIKTTAEAKYKDMVDVLDEMNITNQRKYAMVDIAAEDVELLKLNAL